MFEVQQLLVGVDKRLLQRVPAATYNSAVSCRNNVSEELVVGRIRSKNSSTAETHTECLNRAAADKSTDDHTTINRGERSPRSKPENSILQREKSIIHMPPQLMLLSNSGL